MAGYEDYSLICVEYGFVQCDADVFRYFPIYDACVFVEGEISALREYRVCDVCSHFFPGAKRGVWFEPVRNAAEP